jgi:hypothetical protein
MPNLERDERGQYFILYVGAVDFRTGRWIEDPRWPGHRWIKVYII